VLDHLIFQYAVGLLYTLLAPSFPYPGRLLEPTSEVQEETHVSRTTVGVKLVLSETSLEDKRATERPVDSQVSLNDMPIKNGVSSVVKGSGITAQLQDEADGARQAKFYGEHPQEKGV
jgi:hypothetical protein